MGALVPSTPAVTVLEKQRLGFFRLSLSNWLTNGIPQIVGNVEVAGALYEFLSLESINNWASVSAGTVWIKLIPNIAGTIAAEWTAVVPIWDDEKQGWYSPTVGEENHRYVFEAIKINASNVNNKREMKDRITHKNNHGMEVFTGVGTYSFLVPDDVDYVYLTGCAAGRNGAAGGNGSNASGGAGGAGGGFKLREKVSVTPGGTVSVVIGAPAANSSFGSSVFTSGAGGAGGSGGATGVNGGAGGSTMAKGGGGGTGGTNGGGGGGGGGGSIGVFAAYLLATAGATVGGSFAPGAAGELGGGGGGGGGGGDNGTAGGNGGYGGGGGGGGGADWSSGGAGGTGGPAIIIVEW